MKKSILLFVLVGLAGVTFMSAKMEMNGSKFVKNSWSEISVKEDSTLFVPYCECWTDDWTYYPLNDFQYEKYKKSFEGQKQNLWNLLHAEILNKSFQVYWPNNPEAWNVEDNGFLKYPDFNLLDKRTMANDAGLLYENFDLLGYFGPESNIALTNMYGEDSVAYDSTGYWVTIYPPRDPFWYTDQDIIKYRIREEVVINKKGKEVNRVIKAIAPIVFDRDYSGTIIGEKALFWLDFNDIALLLKSNYLIDQSTGKVISYWDYFSKRKFKATVLKEENFKVDKVE